ncbi:MAG TPA: IPT/TIG domain-containing protein [Candidatus Angelobacter sp.]|jgi:hypothetical protein|nr:IPT/TIG domain-containing protein [Candidatus Angelobacter sp.]
MSRPRTPRRAGALALAGATVAVTVLSLVPRAADAAGAPGRVLSGAHDEVLTLKGVSHPAAVPASQAASVHSAAVAAPLAPQRRPQSPGVRSRVAQTASASGGSVRTLDAARVSSSALSGVDQLQTYQGVSHDSQGPGVSPPDTTMSASASIVAEEVNLTLLTMNHDGSSPHTVLLKDLWNTADSRIGNQTFSISDPRIVFDSGSSRWFTSIVYYDPLLVNGSQSQAAGTNSWIGLAVSTDATPTTWNVFSVKSANGVLMDQPQLGLNGDKVIVSGNDFDYGAPSDPNTGNWIGAELTVVNKTEMVAAVTSPITAHATRRMDCSAFGYAPVIAPTSATTAYVAFNNVPGALPPGCGATLPARQSVSAIAVTGVPTASISATFTQHDLGMCPSCGANVLITAPPAPIPQPNSSVAVDSGDDRFLNAVWQSNMLWTGGSTAVQSADSGLSIFAVNTSNWTLPDAFIISSGAGEDFAYPNYALDQNGTPFFGFSRGSAARFMSSGAFAFDPGSQTLGSAGVLDGGAGQGPYDCNCSGTQPTRWGDYSGSVVDPADPTKVWVATEYSAVGNGHANNWGTLITRLTLTPPSVSTSSPGSGFTRGGTWVDVTGDLFDENSVVLFGGVPAQTTLRFDQQHLRALTPPHSPGPVDVTVSDPAGSATLPGNFTYLLPPRSGGYWMDASDGGIFPYGNAIGWGSHGGAPLNQPMVGMAPMPGGGGYWMVAADGGIFPYGNATQGLGSHGGSPLNKPIVGMAATADGGGYWLVASDGGIFPYGNAGGYGSHGGSPLNQPIVGMQPTPTGHGYWLVASDGGIFPYGDAVGRGSHGGSPLNKPIVGMAATTDGGGYWLVASDGGIFPYGDAAGWGSHGGAPLNQPIVGMAQSGDDGGYWLVAADGGIFPYGDAMQGLGSHGGSPLNKPIVGMAAT